jgi:DNA-binding Lrp family transcriptional regulator
MECLRLPRFTRVAGIAPIELTERDREILRLVHRHRFLRSSHIVQLLGESEQQVLRRLQLLYHHGYLERPRAQIDYYHQGGSKRIVYGLGTKGAALLKRELKPAFHELDWGPKNREVTRLFLEHALLVSDVMVALEMSCRKNGRVRLLHADALTVPAMAHSTREPFQWSVNVSSRLKLGLIPDRVFALESVNGDRSFYFLEADRSTMPVMRQGLSQSSFYRKLLAYEATWTQGIHRSRLGFHRFRVLTVTTSAERVKSLVEACGQLERGQGLFLFAEIDSLLAKPDLLSLAWKGGRAADHSTLCDL